MIKYELLPQQLIHQGIIEESQFFHPQSCTEEQLLLTHTEDYLAKLHQLTLSRKEERKIGFPVRKELIERGKVISHGTLECAQYALSGGSIALNIAGGTHHSFADHGEGFCVFNDFAIAANCLLNSNKVNQALIIDLDVHQGNGTAHIFLNDPRVFTFSVHGTQNYPLKKQVSDLDVELPPGTSDELYLETVHKYIPKLIQQVKPDIIFYLSGVDILETDKLGKLNVSLKGCYERDLIVCESVYRAGVAMAISMGGGYSEDIRHIIDAHTNTYRAAAQTFI